MEVKIGDIRPIPADPWIMPEYKKMESQVITPVTKCESTVPRRVGEESDSSLNHSSNDSFDPKIMKEVAKEVQSFLDDLTICISLSFDDRTGDLVTRVVNKDTGEVIRQIPSEDLIKLRQKLEELRGVLFDVKV